MFLNDLPSANAIKIGNLYFKPRKGIESRVAKSVRLVTTQSKDNPDYLGKAGSCTLLSWCGEYYVVCTRHQLGIKNGENPNLNLLETTRFVSIIDDGILANIPTDFCIFETANREEEYNDILMFRAAKDLPIVDKERANFYPVERLASVNRHLSWIVGYPSERNVMSYEPQHVAIVGQLFDCKFDNQFRSHSQYFKRFTYETRFRELDGFSGGAVFSLIGNIDDYKIVLEGIVLRAGNGFAHIIDSNFLISALSKA